MNNRILLVKMFIVFVTFKIVSFQCVLCGIQWLRPEWNTMVRLRARELDLSFCVYMDNFFADGVFI